MASSSAAPAIDRFSFLTAVVSLTRIDWALMISHPCGRWQGSPYLYVIEQHQLVGMGVQVDLIPEVLNPLAADVVADQGEGHDEGDEPQAVALDRLRQLGAVLAVEGVGDVARQVMEDVRVAAPGGRTAQDRRQAL